MSFSAMFQNRPAEGYTVDVQTVVEQLIQAEGREATVETFTIRPMLPGFFIRALVPIWRGATPDSSVGWVYHYVVPTTGAPGREFAVGSGLLVSEASESTKRVVSRISLRDHLRDLVTGAMLVDHNTIRLVSNDGSKNLPLSLRPVGDEDTVTDFDCTCGIKHPLVCHEWAHGLCSPEIQPHHHSPPADLEFDFGFETVG